MRTACRAIPTSRSPAALADALAPLTAKLLAGVPHGFSTRDAARIAAVMPGARGVRVRQVHSAKVEIARAGWDGDTPEADALVTDRPGLLLAIVTADCAPVLLADPSAGVVGAAHAGWRGAHGGVLENTVAAMESLGAARERLVAAIGPTIAQESYEVDAAFRERFAADDAPFFAPGREGHWQFDLPAYVAARLHRAGIARVEDLGEDTYTQPGRFHSYRRATHLGEPTGGRQVSAIGLPA